LKERLRNTTGEMEEDRANENELEKSQQDAQVRQMLQNVDNLNQEIEKKKQKIETLLGQQTDLV
jgi:transposase